MKNISCADLNKGQGQLAAKTGKKSTWQLCCLEL
jgi:hypothetical protein